MAKIFVRERRHIGKGTGRPRFAIVAIADANVKVYAPHLRKAELEALASACSAEIVYLPRGEKAGQAETEKGEGRGAGGGRHSRWGSRS